MTTNERKKAWAILWKKTHKDFRGTLGGENSIMSWAKYGGGLVTMETITDAERLRGMYERISEE